MRILVICPHYEPDTAPTGVVMTAIAEHLIELGHEQTRREVDALPPDHRLRGWIAAE